MPLGLQSGPVSSTFLLTADQGRQAHQVAGDRRAAINTLHRVRIQSDFQQEHWSWNQQD